MHLAATNSSVSASAANPGSPRAVKQAEQVAETMNQTAIQPANQSENQTPTNHDGCWVNLNAGKPLPGPDEWRALERRASSFRLR
ncbi:MAG: hypothetical protein RL325_1055 [Planctomycetota bacterium]|jgi:hypothetical protein